MRFFASSHSAIQIAHSRPRFDRSHFWYCFNSSFSVSRLNNRSSMAFRRSAIFFRRSSRHNPSTLYSNESFPVYLFQPGSLHFLVFSRRRPSYRQLREVTEVEWHQEQWPFEWSREGSDLKWIDHRRRRLYFALLDNVIRIGTGESRTFEHVDDVRFTSERRLLAMATNRRSLTSLLYDRGSNCPFSRWFAVARRFRVYRSDRNKRRRSMDADERELTMMRLSELSKMIST